MKKLFILFILSVLLVSFAGCGKVNIPSLFETEVSSDGERTYSGTAVDPDEAGEIRNINEAELSSDEKKISYCYSALTDSQKHIYLTMLGIVKNMEIGFFRVCNDYDGYRRDISVAYHALINDRPEIFWIPNSYYISVKNGKVSLSLSKSYGENDYLGSQFSVPEMEEELSDTVDDLISPALNKPNDFEKELAIHDALCGRTVYDSEFGNMIYTSYGALIDGHAVCEGYARAFALLCRTAGLECRVVSGNSKSVGHMWNMVKLDGEWYHVDVTWDDLRESTVHTYFNLTTEEILTDHSIDENWQDADEEKIIGGHGFNYGIDNTAAKKYNYFNYRGLIYETGNNGKAAESIVSADTNGEKYIELKFLSGDSKDYFKSNFNECVVDIQRNIDSLIGRKKLKLLTAAFTEKTVLLYWE